MFNTKYVMSMGLAFAEKQEMEMLSSYAGKGWILYKFWIFGYKLKKAEPQRLQYSLDYRINPDKEYFLYFKEAGWSHVCSLGNTIHIFSAPQETNSIYTDNDTELEKYICQYNMTQKTAIPASLCTILLFILTLLSKYGYIPDICRKIFGSLLIPAVIVAVFSGLPCMSFYFRINKVNKNRNKVSSKNYKIIAALVMIMLLLSVISVALNIFNILNVSNSIYYILCFMLILSWALVCFIK
ncbi:MAG: DUF2812 domain-containing protein [Clostridium sp.]|uniref:DUF2812 domain-containing protein n=1 Tax=Clostridium sp. TaxID=1506 RepID=UPI0025BDF0E9|nr:DUF2812 domain-containing protein [Clostridium sp.]MCH3965210.1 DUF2812 domain-containing protein [Clostridium sp.]MCI1714430.1 DUF2812 domain-containing protein [Clostridium sp.]MCI1798692.1 DUF2812 domain-containing protein [Clostridium sp.]MCI1812577.1 DUF2812 domain-containing protein [Clostridium sp.]MCI1869502.1 DUF2812 domain-containing protein [Clostridium sp.]